MKFLLNYLVFGQYNNRFLNRFRCDQYIFCLFSNIIQSNFISLFVIAYKNCYSLFCCWINSSNLIIIGHIVSYYFYPYDIILNHWYLISNLWNNAGDIFILFVNLLNFIWNKSSLTSWNNIFLIKYFLYDFLKWNLLFNDNFLSSFIIFSYNSLFLFCNLIFKDKCNSLDWTCLFNLSCNRDQILISGLSNNKSISNIL